ncbi:hypothetical protein D9M71_752680 [compost metagenome]
MPEVLELPQLINKHGVPEVQVRSGRVEAGLDAQRLATLELGDQLIFHEDFIRTALDQRELLFDRLHCRVPPVSRIQKGTNHTRSKTKNKLSPASRDEQQERATQGCLKGNLIIF